MSLEQKIYFLIIFLSAILPSVLAVWFLFSTKFRGHLSNSGQFIIGYSPLFVGVIEAVVINRYLTPHQTLPASELSIWLAACVFAIVIGIVVLTWLIITIYKEY